MTVRAYFIDLRWGCVKSYTVRRRDGPLENARPYKALDELS